MSHHHPAHAANDDTSYDVPRMSSTSVISRRNFSNNRRRSWSCTSKSSIRLCLAWCSRNLFVSCNIKKILCDNSSRVFLLRNEIDGIFVSHDPWYSEIYTTYMRVNIARLFFFSMTLTCFAWVDPLNLSPT